MLTFYFQAKQLISMIMTSVFMVAASHFNNDYRFTVNLIAPNIKFLPSSESSSRADGKHNCHLLMWLGGVHGFPYILIALVSLEIYLLYRDLSFDSTSLVVRIITST